MKHLASLAVLVAATIGSAGAAVITYNTTGSSFSVVGGVVQAPNTTSFTSSNGASSATLSFFSIPPASSVDDTNGSILQYGIFQSTFTGPDVNVVIPSFTFVLNVNNMTSGTSALVTGTSIGNSISADSSNVLVTFSPTAFTLGNSNFSVFNPTPIVAPSTGGGFSTVEGFVIGGENPIPEPGTMLLLGAGLLGIGFSARKKFTGRG